MHGSQAERGHEGAAELTRHGTIQQEVYGVVQQGHHVQHISQGPVDVLEEAVDEYGQQRQQTLVRRWGCCCGGGGGEGEGEKMEEWGGGRVGEDGRVGGRRGSVEVDGMN